MDQAQGVFLAADTHHVAGQQGRLQVAGRAFTEALARDPAHAGARVQLARVRVSQGLFAEAVAEAGGRFLEAPVPGTKKPAEDGTLIILCAGDESLYAEVGPLLDLMGKKRVFLGAVGRAARMKLVVNMIMGGMMASFCEGLALADRGGLDASDLLDVLANWGAAGVPADINGDGVVDVLDLLAVIAAWGAAGSGMPEDVNEDGIVDVLDLLAILADWD